MKQRRASISTTFWASMVIVAAIAIVVVGGLWIFREYREFERESSELRQQFITQQRELVRNEVEKVIDFIEYRRSLTEQRLQTSLKERVEEAHSIALNLFETNRGVRTRAEIEEIIKETLRPIRFNKGRGYYFAVSMQGVERLYPVAPQFEDQNLLDLQDERGNYVIRDEIEVIRRDGEGFVRDFWRKPDAPEGMVYPKITFVRYFEPLDWYLGTGEYLDDFERDLKNELIDRIARIRFGDEGYVFINTYGGDPIIKDGRRIHDGQNLWELTDPNGVKVIQEERRAVENPDGGYISYTWGKLTTDEAAPKLSFIKGIPDWEWMVGAGVYLDQVEEMIGSRRQRLQQKVQGQIVSILGLLLALGLVIVLVSRYFYRRVKGGIDTFSAFFERAADEATTIDESELHFSEFVTLARAANTMVEDRRRVEEDRQQLQERLAASRRMEALGLLTGGVAHDLNNILSGIVTYPDLLLMDPDLDAEMRDSLETIKDSGRRAAAVVADLLAASRGGKGASQVMEINDAVTGYLRSPEHQALVSTHPGVRVAADLDPDLLNVRCSRVHLAKALMNLVANAAEAIGGEGTVTISTENRYLDSPIRGFEEIPAGEYAVLRVADDGGGIEAPDLARVFEPFFTKKVLGRSGTGLGLTVVWHTVHDHGGFIDVSSTSGGTAFELYLPVTREPVAEQERQLSPLELRGSGERILVVDDEPRQREIAVGLLASLGYRAEAVDSGEAAIAWLAGNDADLVVLDMILKGGMNGRSTYEAILGLRPGQRAVIASGFAETEDVARSIELGAGAMIRKPYTLQEIGTAVRNELQRGR